MIIILAIYLLLGVLLLIIQNREKRVHGRSRNNHFLSIALTCMLADWLFFHFRSINTGFLFEYYMHLGRLYGDWALIILLLGIGLITGGLLFWIPRMRSKGIFTKIIYGEAAFFLGLIFLGKDAAIGDYGSIWTSGWMESRIGIWYIGGYSILAFILIAVLLNKSELLNENS